VIGVGTFSLEIGNQFIPIFDPNHAEWRPDAAKRAFEQKSIRRIVLRDQKHWKWHGALKGSPKGQRNTDAVGELPTRATEVFRHCGHADTAAYMIVVLWTATEGKYRPHHLNRRWHGEGGVHRRCRSVFSL